MVGEHTPPDPAEAAIYSVDEVVGRDLARVNWAATPLGVPDRWPQSLLTAVSILLSSRFPMWMAWGPELTFFCNDAYRRDTLGRKYPWALGRPANEVWSEIWPDIGPRIERVLSTGEATWDVALLLFLERSGYREETYHTFSYSPLRDDDGHVVGMLCVVSEDTDRVIGERRMATLRDLGSDTSVVRSEQQMLNFAAHQLERNLSDLPFALIYLFGDDGSARLAGASGVPAGHSAAPQVLAADGLGVWPIDDAALGRSVMMDLDSDSLTLPTGSWTEPPAQALVVPLQQQGDAPLGFLVAALNRHRRLDEGYRGFVELVAGHVAAGVGSARSYQSQQRRAEELAELDRAKTTFFSNISHEFRTPLTLILGPVNDLRGRTSDFDDQTRDELELVHRNGLRLAKLVNTLLDFSRIQAGRMRAHFEPVDLGVVTAELASVFRSAVDRAGLSFHVDCPPLSQDVYIDRDMWEKVVLNLLSNALKFTFDGSITVRVSAGATGAVITVADTGTGIPESEMPRLFERFHRIENARARSTEGSGIGLALVKELVGLHGGTITAESAAGAGTTFTVGLPFGSAHLPVADLVSPDVARPASGIADPYVQEALRWLPGGAESEAAPDGTGMPVAVPSSGAPARVLVADDNADMREYLTSLLQSAGYAVSTVMDGAQALDAVRADPPDLLISDVMMPRLDGLELLAALRGDQRTAALPVLLLSARAGQEASIEGLQAGADDYLVKPFAAAELLARVRANVEMARLRNHHADWRSALIDSLQEAFFVCDENGAFVEVNSAFADILGYGPDGLPYEPVQPWWPDADSDPEAHRQSAEVLEALLSRTHGNYKIPVNHRDGHRLWITVSFNRAEDPDSGRRVMVGTIRDVTAEHYAVQRETALAALNQELSQVDTFDQAIRAAAEVLRGVWHARRVLALIFPARRDVRETAGPPALVCAGEPAEWMELPATHRNSILTLCEAETLNISTSEPGTVGIALRNPRGLLVVWIELSEDRPFTPQDHTLLTVLAGRLSQGLQRVHQFDTQRETALALQHAMLGPSRLPGGFTVRYHPASSPLQVGGDWYDVVNLDDGRVAMIVGDCVGHGLAAATVMGQLRSACRALLLDEPSPAAALTKLDRFAARLPGARCTTAFCAVLDAGTGELVYSSAGHPPPVMALADGELAILDDGRGFPLAVRPGQPRPEVRRTIPARATLLLYTDGLVERRRVSLDQGIARAAEVVQEGRPAPLEELADEIMDRLTPVDGYQDDVALLLYRQPGPLEMEFPAEVGQLAHTRTAMREWLDRAGVAPEQAYDTLIATGEAVANAIEHGHRDRPEGTVTLSATVLADRLRVRVVDTGAWRPPRAVADVSRGRGIILMKGLMDDFAIDSDGAGTTVNLSVRIM
ncbi:SpoIIE family protein phosphatase [Mycolicibacterium arseniciresistens]|uniref:histidine kinase n=1 Tax=Mycolicibacterium arseniciresistens TaxID=3062257 RepID=A0ABT8UQ94_9MYCO|nr:SpoIIE family protein phosphatase [Mycolicibacterium arseniciresistens]MDO3639015.1 SpoIIE family protein phosphatase [Mycolicibacterium arseniciresistens]